MVLTDGINFYLVRQYPTGFDESELRREYLKPAKKGVFAEFESIELGNMGYVNKKI